MAKRQKQREFLENYDKWFDDYQKQLEEAQQINIEAKELEKEANLKKIDEAYQSQLDLIEPFMFAESVYLLDGRPLRFTNRDYLKMIYNTDIKNGLLMCGRQVEKSTTFSVKIGNETLLTPFMRSLYMAPLNEQVKVFSEDRLGRLFEYSQEDVIKRTFISTRDKQNVFNKSFSNGSLIYLRHCFGTGDNIRGLSVNGLFGDEVQDIDVDALPVVQETQAHALELGPCFKMTWYSGTPKTFSNTIQQLWNQSNQCEWVIRCEHCHTDQILGVGNITPDKYICRKCGQELTRHNIAKQGRWVKLNSKSNDWGFRITQMMNPSMPAEDIYKKMITYDSQKFNNEVLGRSYENADKPFPPLLLDQMLDNDYKFLPGKVGEFTYTHTFAGVDYGTGGKSYTVLFIIGVRPDGRRQLIYAKVYKVGQELDREWQFNHILGMIQKYSVSYFLADYGHGFDMNQKFKKILGPRFDCVYWSSNLGKEIKYEAQGAIPMWVANRTKIIYEYIKECKEMKHIWAGGEKDTNEDIQIIKGHHLAEQAEDKSTKPKAGNNPMVTRSEELYYTHPVSSPDDAMHAGTYAALAARLKPNGSSEIVFGGAYTR